MPEEKRIGGLHVEPIFAMCGANFVKLGLCMIRAS